MCGIIACRTKTSAIDFLLPALRRLEYRGYDSVGIAVRTTDGDVARLRTVERIGRLEDQVHQWSAGQFSGTGLGHTRWATHGAVTETNAHPHIDCTGDVSLVHNGVIDNAAELRSELTRAGHRFASSVDSEVLCHLIEDELKTSHDLLDAVNGALKRVRGSWGLAVLERSTGRIVVAANRSPLLVAQTRQGDFATSDIAAIADWAKAFRALEDGDVVELTPTQRWLRNGVPSTGPSLIACPFRSADVELNGEEDFMSKEIDEQPEAVSRLLDQFGGEIATGRLWSDLGLPPFARLHVVGCGTSLNAGHVIGNLVRRIGLVPVAFSVASEVTDEVPEPDVLTLAMSQSGETADVLQAVESDGIAGSSLLAITNNTHSTLSRRADAVISCAAGPEIGVAATKTFVCQVVAGVATLISALVALERISPAVGIRLTEALRRLPDVLARSSTVAKASVPALVGELRTASGFIFIARGTGLPYAAEGALKLKELTYRWAEHYPAGELKHGPLALIDVDTPVVVVDNGDPKLTTNVAEIDARGGRVISIGSTGATIPAVSFPQAPWGPIESVLPMQILARTLALSLGRDVDKPRNLAKSVTVE